MTKIEHIVFDVGKVLVHWDPELVYLNLIPDADERTHFLTKICSPEWNAEQDRGRDWGEAEDLLIAEHPEKAELIRAYRGDAQQQPHVIRQRATPEQQLTMAHPRPMCFRRSTRTDVAEHGGRDEIRVARRIERLVAFVE